MRYIYSFAVQSFEQISNGLNIKGYIKYSKRFGISFYSSRYPRLLKFFYFTYFKFTVRNIIVKLQ